MNAKYEKIEFPLGSTIDEVVDKLLSYKEEGKLVYGKFNSVVLYSDTVTTDSAYKAITGKTKEEFDEYISNTLLNLKNEEKGDF